MGCASGVHTKVEPDDSTWNEWTARYERRITNSLPRSHFSEMEDGELTPTEVCSPTTSSRDSMGSRRVGQVANQQDCQTIFFFDWDDTLFPSTWARKKMGVHSRSAPTLSKEHEELLNDVSSRMITLLSEAQSLGTVVIVTNAARAWVDVCCSMLTREANAMLLQIPVIYAMELMSAAEMAELPRNVMCTESKARAMRAMLSSFHMAKSAQRGWINVVSIGDSNFERDAAREVAQSRELGRVASKRCFTKTIKMHERPSVSHMNLQLSVISKWFWTLVHVDCNIDIDMGEH